jgi:hypothetical protein
MIPQEETCPVPDALLGDLYRASPERLRALAQTIDPNVRERLAYYCHRRSHLAKISLALAETGDAHFRQAFHAPEVLHERRRKITLSSGPLMRVTPDEDLVS